MAAASAPPKTEKNTKPNGACGARTKSRAGFCRNRAGFKTDHVGTGRCHLHGGATISGRKTAARELALRLGAELHMEPHDALLLTVRRAANWEAYCAAEVAKLDPLELVVQHRHERDAYGGENATSYVDTTSAAEMHIWLREHQKALDQLARLAKAAIDAGVQERQVRLLEQNAGELATWLGGLLDDLGVKGDKRTPAIVRKHLVLLEGGKAA